MYKYKIALVTLRDVADFIANINSVPYEVYLTDYENKYKVSAKSMISAIATVDWKDTWVVGESEELYSLVKKWIV